MGDNAELWTYPDDKSVRTTITCWLKTHGISYNEDADTDELVQLYRDIECGQYSKTM